MGVVSQKERKECIRRTESKEINLPIDVINTRYRIFKIGTIIYVILSMMIFTIVKTKDSDSMARIWHGVSMDIIIENQYE